MRDLIAGIPAGTLLATALYIAGVLFSVWSLGFSRRRATVAIAAGIAWPLLVFLGLAYSAYDEWRKR